MIKLRCLLTRRMTRTPCFLEVEATCLETGRTRCIPQVFRQCPCNIDSVVDVDGKKDVPGVSVRPRGLVGSNYLQALDIAEQGKFRCFCTPTSRSVSNMLCRNNGLSEFNVLLDCRTLFYDLTHEPGTVLRSSVMNNVSWKSRSSCHNDFQSQSPDRKSVV